MLQRLNTFRHGFFFGHNLNANHGLPMTATREESCAKNDTSRIISAQ